MLDRSFIGKKYQSVVFDVEKQRLRFFSLATGQTDAIYFDEEYAQPLGHPSLLAPPTFLTTIQMEQDKPFEYLDDPNIDIGRILHAYQNYEYFAPIYAGDRVTLDIHICDMYDKRNGELQFCELQSTFTNQNDVLVATLNAAFVVR